MATLLYGPRLGPPAANSFTVWCGFDAGGTAALHVRVAGSSDWTTADTQAIDTSLKNTVVLTASALLARTKYEYRVLLDAVEVAANSTWTMPSGDGRFVAFHISDTHENATAVFAGVLAHWQAVYEPQGIPGFVVYTGDLYSLGADTVDSAVDDLFATEWPDMAACVARLPFAYMADDWDWGGNNSGMERLGGFASGLLSDAQQVQLILWRDRPRPAPPSFAYSFEVCGVPFIVADERSGKTYRDGVSGGLTGAAPKWGWDGSPDWQLGQIWVPAQETWIAEQLRAYRERSLVVFVSTQTFHDVATRPLQQSQPASRDGIGLYYSFQRARTFEAAVSRKYRERPRMVVWSGDDHSCVAGYFTIARGHNAFDTRVAMPYAENLGWPYYEFKVVSSTDLINITGPGLGATSGSTFGNVFGKAPILVVPNDTHAMTLRWDITTQHGGRNVDARITYLNVLDGLAPVIQVDGAGTIGDWRYIDGALRTYSAESQLYPPDNSAEPTARFERGYVDQLLGTIHARDRVARDYDGYLRRDDDVGDPGVDDLQVTIVDDEPPEPPQ